MPEIRLITFDLDNTLWDVGQVIRYAEATMNSWLDREVPAYRQRIQSEDLMALRERIASDRPELRHDVSAFRREVLFQGMRTLGHEEQDARRLAEEAFNVFFTARQKVEFYEHALETLAQLQERYLLAALSNGNAHVESIGLDRYFSFALSSADVQASKPAPDMFHAALEEAGVRPDEAIHVGDHLVDDIHGAGSVGMHTIWVKHGARGDTVAHTQPSATVERLKDLPEAVVRIHEG
ncbi:MAG: HAD-IA family hydrolase [Pseudomonadota bacterium]